MSSVSPLSTPANGSIRIERVTFPSGHESLVGLLHIPAGVDSNNTAPALVVTGAWTTVKEQMAGRYAHEMAERGFLALAFDFRHWGESGAEPRALENPEDKIEDILAAATYLKSRPETTPGNIGGLAVCASAGYLVEAAAQSRVFQSLAFVAPWIHDADLVNETYGGEAAVHKLIDASRTAQRKYIKTQESTSVPATGPKGSDAAMPGVPYYDDPQRGAIPEWDNRFNVASWEGWLTFDAHPTARRLEQPVMIIHSEAAAIPAGAHKLFQELTAPKQQLWLDGVTQFDFYDQPKPVMTATDEVANYFRATLQRRKS